MKDLREGLGPRPNGPERGDLTYVEEEEKFAVIAKCPLCERDLYYIAWHPDAAGVPPFCMNCTDRVAKYGMRRVPFTGSTGTP